ncbi:hypothetical protein DICSQDRAFT_160497 [Dichomitus squalens LYAD-421 SS1]|uniref:uncharacterized protein n=1 Tax=Dichomitus squalens (strain LYAD-421) TaxID=732165 RepID=UPI00044136FB|nr:uncharacterized protein DICSQDRAFT_160497 [Dichomitus squalens LYAD-421 SS1]EJF63279.1 hypothetical protein DICSQDRAFT_160497 [Dichomitus squalens LYAD-421 SS1]
MKAGRATRPPRPRSSTVSYAPVRRTRMPRRRSEEEAEAQYRGEKKLGEPGLLDAWLAARLSQMPTTQTQLRGAERPDEDGYEDEGGGGKGRWGDEVHCTVQVQCIKAPNDPDSIFSDPDTFVLHLTTSSPLSSTRRPIQTTTGAERRLGGTDGSDRWRRIELGTYAGHPESLDAPPWTRLLPAGQVVEFRESAAGLAELLARAAPWNCEDAMTSLGAVSLKDDWESG